MRICRCLLVILAFALIGLPASGGFAADPTGYQLAPGDKLRVTVFGHSTGNVSLPLVRAIPAAGKTIPQLEQAVADALQPDYLRDPRVNVEVLTYRPVYILGEVNNPGSYPYESGLTVDKAIAKAGGFTYRARTGRLKITRSSDPARTQEEATQDTVVMPGDVILVPERYF
jgi:protein involved in polysaccharide export with SLBB domain